MIAERPNATIDREEDMLLGVATTPSNRQILTPEQAQILMRRLAEPAHEATCVMKQAQRNYNRFMAERIA